MAAVGIIDMQRHEAAFVMIGVEQRQLLVAMHGIVGVIDVEGDSLGRTAVTFAPQIHHGMGQADQRAQVRGVLPARHRRLRGQIVAALRQPPTGQLKRRIVAQIVEIVGIRIAAGNGEDAARRMSARCG